MAAETKAQERDEEVTQERFDELLSDFEAVIREYEVLQKRYEEAMEALREKEAVIARLTAQRNTAYGYGSDAGAPPWML